MVAYIQRTDTYETRAMAYAYPNISVHPEVVSSLRGKHVLAFISPSSTSLPSPSAVSLPIPGRDSLGRQCERSKALAYAPIQEVLRTNTHMVDSRPVSAPIHRRSWCEMTFHLGLPWQPLRHYPNRRPSSRRGRPVSRVTSSALVPVG